LKRSFLVLCLALVLSLAFATSAFANFGPHGGYATDTDSCAACHRAHSSFSPINIDTNKTQALIAASGGTLSSADMPNALLVGNAQTIQEFCDACHGDLAPGASTNVQSGRFDAGPSGATGELLGATRTGSAIDAGDTANQVVQYVTQSIFNAPLNGGGFGSIVAGRANQILDTADWTDSSGVTRTYKAVTSAHTMEQTGILWGGGNAVSNMAGFTCTGCHDPHGSSNYRILRDGVNGASNTGSYVGGVPQPAVMSVETNYPNGTGGTDTGWLLHTPGAGQMALYEPNYTSGSSQIMAATLGGNGSLSSWCAGCHTQYNVNSSSYDYGVANEGAVGSQTRHRHPVDIPLTAGDAVLQINAQDSGTIDPRIPLEVNPLLAPARNGLNVGCLTCHFAHGSTALMSGWSNAHLESKVVGLNTIWFPVRDNTMGVSPDKVADPMNAANAPYSDAFTSQPVLAGTSALLRADNRGVCERCHEK